MEAEVRRTHLPGDLYVTFMATIFPLVRFIRRVGRHSLALPPAVPLRRSVRLYVSKLGSPSVRPSSSERIHILLGRRQAGRAADTMCRGGHADDRWRAAGRTGAGAAGHGQEQEIRHSLDES